MIVLAILATLASLCFSLLVLGANAMNPSPRAGDFYGGWMIGLVWAVAAAFWLGWWIG